MTVETATIVSQLDPDLPEDPDLIKEGAAHLRLIKDVLVDNFSTIAGPLTVSHTDLNYVGQTQATSDSSTKVASTACVDAKVLAASLAASIPTQANKQGMSLKTDGTSVAWAFAGFEGYAAKSSNYTVVAADANYVIECTATLTLALTAIATIKKLNFIVYNSSSTGEVTIDPSGSETIDGLTSFIMYPSEARLIQCDGTTIRSTVLKPFRKTYTTSSTFVHPPGYQVLAAQPIGAGGGGGGGEGRAAGNIRMAGSAGGGGACKQPVMVTDVAAGTSTTVTVGAGGTGGAGGATANGSAGAAGGTSSFGTYATSYGGGAGAGGNQAGGNLSGGTGGGGAGVGVAGSTSNGVGGQPQSSHWGGATVTGNIGDGGGACLAVGLPGCAVWGGGAGGVTLAAGTGSDAGASSQYGAGGGGGGGGLDAANAQAAGGAGGKVNGAYTVGGGGTAGATSGGAGGAGAASVNGTCGQGGGGGGANSGGTGGVGGAGGAPGGGGGGGGGGTSTGGAGGAGGRGEVRVWGIV